MEKSTNDFCNYPSDEYSTGHFHEVILLHDSPEIAWEEAHLKSPKLSRGWFELSRLSGKDRVEFTREFWLSHVPYHFHFKEFLENFFAGIEEIGIYLVQQKFDDPFEPHMVYSLSEGKGFFRGFSCASESQILGLKQSFPNVIFPADYFAFMQIHDGFCKTTDNTGIVPLENLKCVYLELQSLIASHEGVLQSGDKIVDPSVLFPFYKSFGMPFFQCFWPEWYPEEEMGNVYYSGTANTISDIALKSTSAENMAFPTFTDWLMFYLETIEV
jgi:hypothetical protein